MKRILFLMLVILVLAGCQAEKEAFEKEEKIEDIEVTDKGDVKEIDVKTEDGEMHAEVTENSDDTVDMTVTAEDQEIEVKGTKVDAWCQEGAEWQMTSGEGAAKMVIVGLETSGKYAGYCHVKYDMSSQDAMVNADFYFNEEGSGYQVMDINGQKIETAWTK